MRQRRPPPAPRPQRFELEVQPEGPDSSWHACLRRRGSTERAEFDSPLALLRHLAQLTLAGRKGGLR
jgi:hypothetical protein